MIEMFFEQAIQNLLDIVQLGFLFPMRHIASALGAETYTVKVRGAGQVTMRAHSSDAAVIRQVFRAKDYDFSRFPHAVFIEQAYRDLLASGATPVIIDAGANIGASTLWFARQFPEARVIAIEPEASNAALCRRNLAGTPNAAVVEAALGAESGRVRISAGVERWAFQTQRCEDGGIEICTIDDLVSQTLGGRLFIVKIDIEGFEKDVFAANVEWIDAAEVIILEPHDWMLPGHGTSFSFQHEMGARRFDMLLSGENLIYVRAPAA